VYLLTVDNNTPLEAIVGGVGEDKEYIHKRNQPDLAWPLLAVDGDFPWVDVTASIQY
jgi:hypothetical protein